MSGISENLGELLRSAFTQPGEMELPRAFQDLLDRLDASEVSGVGALDDDTFKRELTKLIPQLRAFGRTLSGDRDLADDLAQTAMLKAWRSRDRFQGGTNMRAWTFMILRNEFLSQIRRRKFRAEWSDAVADRVLIEPASQGKSIEVADVQRALDRLPPAQREALMLVGASGMTYEEAAEVTGVALGTIKSRIARGRAALEALVDGEELEDTETRSLAAA